MNKIWFILFIIACIITVVPIVLWLFGTILPFWAMILCMVPSISYALGMLALMIITKIAKKGV